MNRKITRLDVFVTILCVIFIYGIVQAIEQVRVVDRAGTERDPVLFTLQEDFELIGTWTASSTTPGPTNRTYARFTSQDAKNVTINIPPQWNGIRVRLASTTDGDSTVTDMFLADPNSDAPTPTIGDFTRKITLTWTTGTQTCSEASGYEWADTVAASNEAKSGEWEIESPTGNYIAEARVDAKGAIRIGVSTTTLTNNAKMYVKGY